MRTAKALALAAWLLVIAWLLLLVTDRSTAAGWCLLIAGVLLMVAGPIFQRVGDGQLRITGVIMAAARAVLRPAGLVLRFLAGDVDAERARRGGDGARHQVHPVAPFFKAFLT